MYGSYEKKNTIELDSPDPYSIRKLRNDLDKARATAASIQGLAPVSDETMVGNNTWADLKPHAMKKAYQSTSWFEGLNDEEKQLLEVLRAAQTN